MIGSAVRAIGWRTAWVAVIGLVGSQAGHLLVYRLRFGVHAASVQSTGSHAYFQAAASSAFALAGVALIAALGVIGAARAVAGRRSGRVLSGPSVLELAAALFTLQLALFALQESVESLGSGSLPLAVLLVYGVACQLPVALAGAMGLSLFLARFEEAVELLRGLAPQPGRDFQVVDRRAWAPVGADRLAPQRRPAGPGSRGPP
jgi:hypothetical protein